MTDPRDDADDGGLARWGADLRSTFAFFTRLPLIRPDDRAPPPPDFSTAARAIPLVGLAVGVLAAATLAAGHYLGLTTLVTAALAAGVAMLVTGALHEDGLADTVDGLAGGWTRKARLEIMRDSRIGTYGALALALALILRVGTVAGLLDGAGLVAAMLIVATGETVSRAGMVWLAWRLPPARADGFAATAGRPRDWPAQQSFVVAALAGFVLMATAIGVLATAFALAAAGLAILAMTALARHAIGGQTGDLAGATQQAALIAFLVAALAAAPV